MLRTVGDLMTREVITISEEDNLSELDHGMEEFGLRHLPVVSDGRLVGLISHRDLLRFSFSSLDKSPRAEQKDRERKENTFAASVMTRDIVTVRPETMLLHAVRLMINGKFGCLPVVEEGDVLVGIISEHDLLKELAKELQEELLREIS